MATLTLTYDTGSVTLTDLNDTLALELGYEPIINGAPNPETKAQFNRRIIGQRLREMYRSAKRRQAYAEVESTIPDTPMS